MRVRNSRRCLPLLPVLALVLNACSPSIKKDAGPMAAATVKIESAAFKEGEKIPKTHSGEGEDRSPPLAWSNLPAAARELALVCDDPDAPGGEPWVHWGVYNLPTG